MVWVTSMPMLCGTTPPIPVDTTSSPRTTELAAAIAAPAAIAWCGCGGTVGWRPSRVWMAGARGKRLAPPPARTTLDTCMRHTHRDVWRLSGVRGCVRAACQARPSECICMRALSAVPTFFWNFGKVLDQSEPAGAKPADSIISVTDSFVFSTKASINDFHGPAAT